MNHFPPISNNQSEENFEDFFEIGLCGFVITNSRGIILRANNTIAEWTGHTKEELKNKRFHDILTIGGKIYFETHLWPLIRMQSFFDEIILEIAHSDGSKLQVLVNAIERRYENDAPAFIRFTVLKCSDRLQYEQNLKLAKAHAEKELVLEKRNVTLREQLIAVLGHDLRNPLSSIIMVADMIENASGEDISKLLPILKRSTYRMKELITNIMDFARARLGEGVLLQKINVLLEPFIEQVISELKIANPQREIIFYSTNKEKINCDPYRIAQLVSNIVSNALTHGNANSPINVNLEVQHDLMQLSVVNKGNPIPVELYDQVFEPFTKKNIKQSNHGLGLGLYISAEIARAHNGKLSFTSNQEKTCFIFEMKL